MEELVPAIEDGRGVDVTQIRQLLRMTVAERVAEMVAASNTVLDIQARVGRTPTRSTR